MHTSAFGMLRVKNYWRINVLGSSLTYKLRCKIVQNVLGKPRSLIFLKKFHIKKLNQQLCSKNHTHMAHKRYIPGALCFKKSELRRVTSPNVAQYWGRQISVAIIVQCCHSNLFPVNDDSGGLASYSILHFFTLNFSGVAKKSSIDSFFKNTIRPDLSNRLIILNFLNSKFGGTRENSLVHSLAVANESEIWSKN